MATETIPVIDLGPFLAGEPGALDRTAKELRFALTEIGFYFIVNHGVPREKIRGAFEQVKRFHAQPVEKKLALKIDLQQHRLPADARQHAAHLDDPDRHQAQPQRGLLRQARDAGRSSRRAGRPPLPRRQPLAANLPGFRETVVDYCDTLERLVQKMVRLYARALDLPAAVFRRAVQGAASTRCA